MRRLLLILPCLLFGGCVQTPAEPAAQQDTPASPAPVTEPVRAANGYLFWSEPTGTWYLKQPQALDPLDFNTMKTCLAEATGQPCTASGMTEGMELTVNGYREIRYDGTLHVEDARIIGTTRTFSESGQLERRADGSMLFSYQDRGEDKTIRVSYDAKTTCSDDGMPRPCGSWMNGRGGSVTGELRQGEAFVRATWIDLP